MAWVPNLMVYTICPPSFHHFRLRLRLRRPFLVPPRRPLLISHKPEDSVCWIYYLGMSIFVFLLLSLVRYRHFIGDDWTSKYYNQFHHFDSNCLWFYHEFRISENFSLSCFYAIFPNCNSKCRIFLVFFFFLGLSIQF